MNESKKYISTVVSIEENGDAVIEFPPEMIEDLQWKIDDKLTIKQVKGQIIIENITQNLKSIKE